MDIVITKAKNWKPNLEAELKLKNVYFYNQAYMQLKLFYRFAIF